MLNCFIKTEDNDYKVSSEYKRYRIKATGSFIYKKDNIILKKYIRFIPERLRITEELFKILKDINEDCFIKLLDYYKDNIMIGYSSYFIENEEFNIFDKDLEFLEYNLQKLDKLLLLLIENQIVIDDLKYRNYLLHNNNLVIIDPDSYRQLKDRIDVNDIKKYNYQLLIDSIKDIFINSYYKKHNISKIGSEEFHRLIYPLFKYTDNNPLFSTYKNIKESDVYSKAFKKM